MTRPQDPSKSRRESALYLRDQSASAVLSAGVLASVATVARDADAAIMARRERIQKMLEPNWLGKAAELLVGPSSVARDEDAMEDERMVEARVNQTIRSIEEQEQRSLNDSVRESIRESVYLHLDNLPGDQVTE